MPSFSFFFFFNDTATTEIYTLSLHDALPISEWRENTNRIKPDVVAPGTNIVSARCKLLDPPPVVPAAPIKDEDRKSTRLNSSHLVISYAVFCLKKKSTLQSETTQPTRGM